jgi:uncharacterized membrane protein YgcG
MKQLFRLFLVLGCASSLIASIKATSWSPSEFPNPKTDWKACNRNMKSSVCDPDRILTKDDADLLDGTLIDLYAGNDPFARLPCADEEPQGLQVGVAIINHMKIPSDKSPVDQAAYFAQQLHNQWGVGDKTCKNGVLLFLSIQDRQAYISTDDTARTFITDKIATEIITSARPLLRSQKYGDAVYQILVDIGMVAAGHALPDSHGEEDSGWDWFGIILLLFILTVMVSTCWQSYKRRREYNECRNVLSKLKTEQDNLRSRVWSTPRSCPICLEDFNPPPVDSNSGSEEDDGGGYVHDEEDGGPSAPPVEPTIGVAVGGDGVEEEEEEDAAPLLAGTSAAAAVGSGSGGLRRRGGKGSGKHEGMSSSSTAAAAAAAVRKPPVTLHCGHTFCEQCIESWFEKKKTSCPICRKSVLGGDDDSNGGSRQQQQQQQQPPVPRHDDTTTTDNQQRRRSYRPSSVYARHRYDITDELLAAELAFRLASVHSRYPSYVTPGMVDQWSAHARSGRSFDPLATREFQLNNPVMQAHRQGQGSSGVGMSFGGGSSSGGGGGSW